MFGVRFDNGKWKIGDSLLKFDRNHHIKQTKYQLRTI